MRKKIHSTTSTGKARPLPTTEDEFRQLVEFIMEKFEFTEYAEVAYVVGNRIQHLPVDQDTETPAHFAACVKKAMAYKVARKMVSEQLTKAAVDDAVTALEEDETDKKALDYLTEQSTRGCEYASKRLQQYLKDTETARESIA